MIGLCDLTVRIGFAGSVKLDWIGCVYEYGNSLSRVKGWFEECLLERWDFLCLMGEMKKIKG